MDEATICAMFMRANEAEQALPDAEHPGCLLADHLAQKLWDVRRHADAAARSVEGGPASAGTLLQ
jgi:hypothetical protein